MTQSQNFPGICLVTPVLDEAASFLPSLRQALAAGGVASVLLRHADIDANAIQNLVKELAKPVQETGAAFVVAGDPRLALEAGADGAHVGGVGRELTAALKLLAPDHIVGAGGLPTRHDAMVAGESGAEYVLFGDWDAPLEGEALIERVQWWTEIFNAPCVALAKSLSEARPLAEAGADFIMLGECVWSHPLGPAEAVREARRAVGELPA